MEAPEFDLLQHVAVRVPCTTCGHFYDVNLRDVLSSQGMLHDGCPVGTETECPPLTYAGLANEAALREFETSWSRLRDLISAAGYELTICRPGCPQ
jgi:hypothetical protein